MKTTIFGTRIKGRLSPLPIITYKLKQGDKIMNGIGVYVFSVITDDGQIHVVDAAVQVWHDLNDTLVLSDGRELPLLEGSILDKRMRTKVDHVPSPVDNAIEYAKEFVLDVNAQMTKHVNQKFFSTLEEETNEAEEHEVDDQEVPEDLTSGDADSGDSIGASGGPDADE